MLISKSIAKGKGYTIAEDALRPLQDYFTIIQAKGKEYVCSKCGKTKFEQASYDLNEYAFSDRTYMYDGQEHQLVIQGMIPYGCTVEYENNVLKEIGSKEATARVYNESHQLIDQKNRQLNHHT